MKMSRLLLIFVWLMIPMTTAQSPDSITVTHDILYTTPLADSAQEHLLDVYAPEQADNLPVVVILHGSGGSKNTNPYPELSEVIAEHGAIVFNANISQQHGASLYAEDENGAGIRRYIEEAVCAIRFARATAGEYGGNSDHLIIFGHSGGGYAGLWASLVNDELTQVWNTFAESRGAPVQQVGCLADNTVSAKPTAMITYAGAFIFFEQGQYIEEDAELQQLISPHTYFGVHPDIILRFIWGRNDTTMPSFAVDWSEEWYIELADAGYNITWTVIEGEHNIPIGTPAESSLLAIIDEVLLGYWGHRMVNCRNMKDKH